MYNLIKDAKSFSEKAHEGQIRKGTDTPYFTHPKEVAKILMDEGMKDELIAAGYLHDTLEDTDTTLEDLLIIFGPCVAQLVLGASEHRNGNEATSKDWKIRKDSTIKFLKNEATWEIKAVVLADKLANLRSIEKDLKELGDEVWKRFNAGKELQKWYYSQLIISLFSTRYRMESSFKEFCSLYEKIFGESGSKEIFEELQKYSKYLNLK